MGQVIGYLLKTLASILKLTKIGPVLTSGFDRQ